MNVSTDVMGQFRLPVEARGRDQKREGRGKEDRTGEKEGGPGGRVRRSNFAGRDWDIPVILGNRRRQGVIAYAREVFPAVHSGGMCGVRGKE